MQGINTSLLRGPVARDAETKFTKTGSKVTNFRIATPWTRGEDKSGAQYHSVSCWGELADKCEGLKEGIWVVVYGPTNHSKVDGPQGTKYYSSVNATFVGVDVAYLNLTKDPPEYDHDSPSPEDEIEAPF